MQGKAMESQNLREKTFNVKKIAEVSLKSPVLIEGLPGIGSVGKITMDFLISQLKPTLLYEISSYDFPHSVFINDDDTIEEPSVKIYGLKRAPKQDIVFLWGNVQPVNERSSYIFAEEVVNIADKLGCKELITLGGVGWNYPPEKLKLYCIGNNIGAVKKFKSLAKDFKFHSSNGSIANVVGATGILLSASTKKNIDAVSFLIDTFGHPLHKGLEESKQLLLLLKSIYDFKLDLSKIDKDIEDVKEDRKAMSNAVAEKRAEKLAKEESNISYIG